MNRTRPLGRTVEQEEYFHPVSLPLRIVMTTTCNDSLHPVHGHDFTELVIVASGTAVHLTGRDNAPICPGDVLLVQRGASHGYADMRNFRLINLLFIQRSLPLPLLDFGSGALAEKLFAAGPARTECRAEKLMILPPETLRRITDLTCRIAEEEQAQRSSFHFQIMAFFMEILVLLDRVYAPDQPPEILETVPKALEFLENNYRTAVDLTLLARRLGMSRRSFFRHFRAAAGTSPLQYLHHIRLRHATRMLRQTALSIDAIALEVGYQDRAVFSRHFHAVYHCPPSHYRKTAV